MFLNAFAEFRADELSGACGERESETCRTDVGYVCRRDGGGRGTDKNKAGRAIPYVVFMLRITKMSVCVPAIPTTFLPEIYQ